VEATDFRELVGIDVVAVTPERVSVEWQVEPAHHQPSGITHGGVYCTAVETAASLGAAAWLGDRGEVVGVSNHTNFIRAVRSGRLRAVATPIHRGRSQQLWQVDVVDDEERLVARGEVRLHNLERE
jgi:1,4-dihydroxy-2-naphthoyl-CoA hydrolase